VLKAGITYKIMIKTPLEQLPLGIPRKRRYDIKNM
jgi:hypothetical protein